MVKIKNNFLSRHKITLILLSVVGFSFNIHADTIYLKDGNAIENVKNIKNEDGIVYFVIEGWESDVRSYREEYIERIEKSAVKKKKSSSGDVYSPAGFDFRKTKWGMSPNDVIDTEGANPDDKGTTDVFNYILYKKSVLETDVFCIYYFFKNKLMLAKYFNTEKHSNKNDYILDYVSFQKILREKYGPAHSDKIIWKDDLYRDDNSEYGLAISIGHLVFSSKWKTASTIINCKLTGDNYLVKCEVWYTTRDQRLLSLLKNEGNKIRMEDF